MRLLLTIAAIAFRRSGRLSRDPLSRARYGVPGDFRGIHYRERVTGDPDDNREDPIRLTSS